MKFIIFALLVTLACVFVIPSEAAAAPNDCGDTSALEKACEDLMNLPDGAGEYTKKKSREHVR